MTTFLKSGLSIETVEALKSVFKGHPKISTVILYGSRAKGNYKEGSDIDLTIMVPTMNTDELLKIESDIEELMLPYKVDLSLHHQITNTDLLDHIKRVGIKLYAL